MIYICFRLIVCIYCTSLCYVLSDAIVSNSFEVKEYHYRVVE